MKVLLIVPTHGYKGAYPNFLSVTDFPTGFAYLASSLKEAGHEVYGLNLNNDASYQSAYEMVNDRICHSLEDLEPDLIGLGGLCIDYHFLRDAINIIREKTDTPIVLGGGIVTHDAEYIFQLLKPDYCIIGEGEETIVKLANGETLDTIDNMGYWDKDKPIFTRINHNYRDINERPFPGYEPFGITDMMDNYSMATRMLYSYTRPEPRPMVIVTARGCPFNCTFCVHQGGAVYRARSIENIMREIALMYERYKFNILIVNDELFVLNKRRMKDFCTTLIRERKANGWDFDWMFQTHPSASLDYESLELAKQAGCYLFSYGLESASPTILKSMNKKTKVSQIVEAMRLADAVGIGFAGNLIFGDPAETLETIRETMEFFLRQCQDEFVFPGLVQPYPGSKIFEDAMSRGIIINKLGYYENIDKLAANEMAFNLTSMPNELLLKWSSLLQAIGMTKLWLKSTDTISCDEEDASVNHPMIKHGGRIIMNVRALCPHCGKEVYYRMMLGRNIGTDNQSPITLFAPGCTHCNKMIRVKLPKLKEV